MKVTLSVIISLFCCNIAAAADKYSVMREELQQWENQGTTTYQIAKRLNVSPSTLYSFMKKKNSSSPTVSRSYEAYKRGLAPQAPIAAPLDEVPAPIPAAVAQAPIAGILNPIPQAPNQVALDNKEQAPIQPKYYDGYDSEDEDAWTYKPTTYPKTGRNTENVMIPFFRGVHFFQDHFPMQKKIDFLNSEQVGDGVFSTASFDVLQLDYTEQELSPTKGNYQRLSLDLKKEIRQKALEIQTSTIRRQVIKLKDGQPITVDGIHFQNPQIGLYYLYVKSYARFLDRLKDKTFLPKEALNEFIAVANPIASAAEIPDHALRYAAGLKIAGQVTRPEFDTTGKPKNPYLGKVYVILVPQEDIQKLGLFRVLEAYASNQMAVNCRIINECEADFPGGIPGQYVVSERVVLYCPQFGKRLK